MYIYIHNKMNSSLIQRKHEDNKKSNKTKRQTRISSSGVKPKELVA